MIQRTISMGIQYVPETGWYWLRRWSGRWWRRGHLWPPHGPPPPPLNRYSAHVLDGRCLRLVGTPPNFDAFPADVPYSAYQRMQTIRRKAKRGCSEVSRSVQFSYLSGSVIHSARYLGAPNHLCFGTRDI